MNAKRARLIRKYSSNQEISILFIEELSGEEVDDLWTQNVNMDDWDYILVCSADTIIEKQRLEKDWETNQDVIIKFYEQKNWQLDNMLCGCFKNVWYKVNFRGQTVALGIAYHS